MHKAMFNLEMMGSRVLQTSVPVCFFTSPVFSDCSNFVDGALRVFIEFSHCVYTGLKQHVAAHPKNKTKKITLIVHCNQGSCLH